MNRRVGVPSVSVVEEIRGEIRAMDFPRVADDELARLARIDAEGEHNDAIEGIVVHEVSALFAMLREERAPIDVRRHAVERFLSAFG